MADTVVARCAGLPTEGCGWEGDLKLTSHVNQAGLPPGCHDQRCPGCGGMVEVGVHPVDLLSDQGRATLQANLDAMATARRAGMGAAMHLPLGGPAGAERTAPGPATQAAASEALKQQAIDVGALQLAAALEEWLWHSEGPGGQASVYYRRAAELAIDAAWGLLGHDLEPGDLAGEGELAHAEAAATLRAMIGERCHQGCNQPLHADDKRAALQAGADALAEAGRLEREFAGLRGEHELAKAHFTGFAGEAVATERGLRERLRQARVLIRWAAAQPCQCEDVAGPGSGGPRCAPCDAKAFLSEVVADG
jgi:hypothetical protein